MKDDFAAELLMKYKTPDSVGKIVTQQTINVELNRNNYCDKMHHLLMLEEIAQNQAVLQYVYSFFL